MDNNRLQYYISAFFNAAQSDPRIGPVHISLFMAIVWKWLKSNGNSPVLVFRKDLAAPAKILGIATYCKTIKELHEYGYIKYSPSYNRLKASEIYIK